MKGGITLVPLVALVAQVPLRFTVYPSVVL
jgi:hypothetical protein